MITFGVGKPAEGLTLTVEPKMYNQPAAEPLLVGLSKWVAKSHSGVQHAASGEAHLPSLINARRSLVDVHPHCEGGGGYHAENRG